MLTFAVPDPAASAAAKSSGFPIAFPSTSQTVSPSRIGVGWTTVRV